MAIKKGNDPCIVPYCTKPAKEFIAAGPSLVHHLTVIKELPANQTLEVRYCGDPVCAHEIRQGAWGEDRGSK